MDFLNFRLCTCWFGIKLQRCFGCAANGGPVKPQLSSTSANGADALVKPQRSVAVKLFKQLCLRCPPQTGKAKELLRESMGHEIVVIARFFEDAAIFVLSRLWFDTISSYCLGLRPITYCSSPEAAGLLEAECVSLAPAWRQYVFALVALPIAGLLKHLVEWSGLTKKRGFDQVPMMLKYSPPLAPRARHTAPTGLAAAPRPLPSTLAPTG